MPSTKVLGALHSLTAAMLVGACSSPSGNNAQQAEATAGAPDPAIARHIDRARELAGADVTAPFDFYCIPGNARPNSGTAPELEPVQIFDNLYAVGNSETTVYAITTSDGIILIDSGYADRVETVLVPGLIELGLDPAEIKFVLLGHGHGDHYGGAAYLQEHYGARIGTMAIDWDLIAERAAAPGPNDPPAPTRDFVIRDRQPIMLGDTTVTPVSIPGHTQGSLAYIFSVYDDGVRHVAGLFGGTILAAERIPTPGLQQYVDSIASYLDVAQRMGVEVEVQNHPLFDNTLERLAALEARRPGEPHPFMMGAARYVRFWNTISECIQAEIVRRGDAA